MTEVNDFVRFLASCRYEQLPASTVTAAKSCLLDWFGVALAASQRRDFAESFLAVVEDLGGAPRASVIGTGVRTSVSSAAFANGTIARSLDFDEFLLAARGTALCSSAIMDAAKTYRELADLGTTAGRKPVTPDRRKDSARRQSCRSSGRGEYSCSAH